MTNSITVLRTLNMLIAASRHRFSSLLLTELEVCHSHEIRTLPHNYKALYKFICFIFYCMHTDTTGSLLVAATVPVVDRFGWFAAMEEKPVSQTVNTAAGTDTTAHTITTSLFHASLVLLQTFCSSLKPTVCL